MTKSNPAPGFRWCCFVWLLFFFFPDSARGKESLLRQPLQTVVSDKDGGDGSDPHDYRSLAIYWWPNPVTGIPYYRRDGIRNPEANQYDSPKLQRFLKGTGQLVAAWKESGDPRYASDAARRIRAWFLDAETRMNPNFNYAQFIPGIRSGSYHGIVEANGLSEDFLDHLRLLHDGGWLDAKDWQGIQQWYRQFLAWLETSPNGRTQNRQRSNQSLWYDFQRTRIALFLGEEDHAQKILTEVGPGRIDLQIEPDGRMPAEMERTRSFHYVCYALRPLLGLAAMAKDFDLDLAGYESPKGGSIRRALLFAAQNAENPEHWPGRQIQPIRPEPLLRLMDTYLQLKPTDEEVAAARERLVQAFEEAPKETSSQLPAN